MLFEVQDDIPLAPYSTLKVGGIAKYFVTVKTEDELVEACKWAEEQSVRIFVLGGGSNVLFSDTGFDGLVVLINIRGCSYGKQLKSGDFLVKVNAGEFWDDFVGDCVTKGFEGAECLSGVPGKVGGSVVQNIGAYGQEISEIVEKIRFYDLKSLAFKEYSRQECKFGYRQSVFKGDFSKIVTAVWFSLQQGTEPKLKYKELVDKFEGQEPDAVQVRKAVLEIRKSKSMVLDPLDANSVSAGSFFKNPVVARADFEKIKKQHDEIPNWSQPDGQVKLSAGWLIETSGLPKGYIYKDGKVGLSQKHALALINRGEACANDVLEFSNYIQDKVLSTFGVKLEPEVVFVGFD